MLAFISVGLLFLASAAPQLPCVDPQVKPPGPDGVLKPAPLVPLLVGDVIESLGLDEAKMFEVEEPPGKLRALRWSRVKFAGTVVDVELEVVIPPVVIRLNDGRSLTFERRDIKHPRAVRVTKVTIAPSAKRID